MPNSPIRRTSRPTSRTVRESASPKRFLITDADHTLLASSRGLEFYAHRLDPGNHCNLLHLFELDKTGRPVLVPQPGAATHYKAAWEDNPTSAEGLADDFLRMKRASRHAWTRSRRTSSSVA